MQGVILRLLRAFFRVGGAIAPHYTAGVAYELFCRPMGKKKLNPVHETDFKSEKETRRNLVESQSDAKGDKKAKDGESSPKDTPEKKANLSSDSKGSSAKSDSGSTSGSGSNSGSNSRSNSKSKGSGSRVA